MYNVMMINQSSGKEYLLHSCSKYAEAVEYIIDMLKGDYIFNVIGKRCYKIMLAKETK